MATPVWVEKACRVAQVVLPQILLRPACASLCHFHCHSRAPASAWTSCFCTSARRRERVEVVLATAAAKVRTWPCGESESESLKHSAYKLAGGRLRPKPKLQFFSLYISTKSWGTEGETLAPWARELLSCLVVFHFSRERSGSGEPTPQRSV